MRQWLRHVPRWTCQVRRSDHRYEGEGFNELLDFKFKELGKMGLQKKNLLSTIENLETIGEKSNEELKDIYPSELNWAEHSIDEAKDAE